MPTVLCADADRELRDVYVWLLSSYGFRVETADDGLECLAKLRQFVPDLLLLDLELPWGGGDGVLEVMRGNLSLLPVRVVLTSSVASAQVLDGLASPPAVQALAKPFQLSALVERAALAEFIKQQQPSNGTRMPSRRCVDTTLHSIQL